jgi:membrane-associated phospholipid phosphatase
LIFVTSALKLAANDINQFDQYIINAVSRVNSPLMTEIMKMITSMGSAAAMTTIVVVIWLGCFIYKKHWWGAATGTIVLAGAWLMNALLKWMFHRGRPTGLKLVEAAGYSFPSGHAMISLAFYGIVGYLLWINLPSRAARFLIVLLLAVLVLLIGISRIYLGVHFPSDVIAGFAAGGFILIASILGLQAVGSTRRR